MSALFFGGNNNSTSYNVYSSRRSTPNMAEPVTIHSSSELALINSCPPTRYTNLQQLRQLVIIHFNKVKHGEFRKEYFSISGVSPRVFDIIENHRRDLGSAVRFTYFADISTLIIKVVVEPHESAHLELGAAMIIRASQMGISRREFKAIGSTRHHGVDASQKEGDSSYINRAIRLNPGDWPSIVIEAGYSESLPRLRNDMKWWIDRSGGEVRIVLLVKLSPITRNMVIEKWIPRLQPRQNEGIQVATIDITSSTNPPTVTRDPLILEFDKVFLRPANPPNEQDIQFTRQHLEQYASLVWDDV
ncbi:hypothetical protein B7463_g1551, partial [Scytalidium lignicola]